MIQEFKEFINRGSVIDLAVAVIIGAAFSAIVGSLVNDIIMPIIGVLMGGVDFSGLAIEIGNAAIGYGNFIQAIINFLLIAFVLFMIIKAMNSRKKEEAPVEEAPAGPTSEELLIQIRDLLAKR